MSTSVGGFSDVVNLPSPNAEVVGLAVVVEDGTPNAEFPVPPPKKIRKGQFNPTHVISRPAP